MKFWLPLIACFLFAPLLSSGKTVRVDETPDFALLDFRGREYRLRRTDAKAVVLFFTATGCPVAEQSFARLKALQKKYDREGIRLWLIDSNTADDRAALQKQAQEFRLTNLPLLQDETQGVAAMLGVKRTGTVIAIETRNWSVFYRGAIDDQMVEGAQKPQATVNYLADALDAFLANKKVEVAETNARGCIISFEKAAINYATQVAPILESKCFGCHSPGNIGSFAMTNYARVKSMSDMIQETVLARRMPPWQPDRHHGKFANGTMLTIDQARTLLRWIEQGAQRGEGDDPLEKAVAHNTQWPLGEPDAVVSLPKFEEIAATGVFDYRHIKAKVPFEEDVWIKGVVARPGNRRVVHHIIVRVREPGKKEDDQDDAFLIGWAPGGADMFFPEGAGKRIKKGSMLDFEMHYTASGKPETDQSSIGLYVMNETPKMAFKTRGAYKLDLEIASNDASSPAHATYVFKNDALLYDLSPHMHLRGAWMKFEAFYPNGKRETLLNVPHYDFNWQHNYRLKEPKRMPAGTWILCTGAFNNSKTNPYNPDPAVTVNWGDQSFDEMFIGFMGIAELPKDRQVSAK
jgi:peroxiredoxin